MFATLTISGSGAASTQTACGRSARTIRSDDDRVLAAVLVAAQQLLAEVVVDRGVGAAPGRAGEGDGRDAGARAAHQQLGAGADEGRLRASRSRSRSRPGTARASRRRRRRGRGRPRRSHEHLAGEHDLLESRRRAIRSVGGRDRGLELAGRAGAADLGAPDRVRVEHRQRLARAGRRAAPRAPSSASAGVLAGPDDRVDGQEGLRRRCGRSRAPAGPSSAGGNEDQVGEPPPSVGRRRSRRPRPAPPRPAGPRALLDHRVARRVEALARPPRRTGPARARSPRARRRARPARTRAPAAPSRTIGRRRGARRRPPRRDRRPRPESSR